ncbi:Fumarate reductase/succinate dehydrogenase, flavoprotein subunit (plasmid) [Sodalis praecaptivus]|uniref:Fumarate reductase/succinate dehydrogenase, flavoprotein subunit n=1 Tax=Sodalis praecaptivus TaxID=1239307 RepID=W0HZ81_9GAMM|nr:FAD-dependent oxidoreductase [Sodalis praecaptivus]AHF79084.1 Fumarate reductase/succinate dehydrogenase, flavoprotein subunit [Sodalis praecaptivus]
MSVVPSRPAAFDTFYDVVVVGFGFAGGAAALAAHDAGARVLLIEKMPDPGGISICAGGGVRTVTDRAQGRAYLRETAGPDVPDDVIDMMTDGMAGLEAYFRELAKINNATIQLRDRGGNYPFPGHDALGIVEVAAIPGFDARKEYPHARGRLLGPNVFKLLHDNIRARGIDIWLETAAERLITDAAGAVLGLRVNQRDEQRHIGARRGVILATGGFEAAPEMQRKYWQIRPVMPAATRANTGDGIRMAQAVGADLWHMWHFHGSYGFRHVDASYPYALRVKRLPDWTPQVSAPEVAMSWIVLNRRGQRFMNEYQPYVQDTGHRPLDQFDPVTQRFPHIPAFLVVDEEGRQRYPLGQAVLNDRATEPYVWSDDNLKEVENGILQRAESVEALATLIGAEPDALRETLARWNRQCEQGRDDDFARPASSMLPVKTPPFYVGQLWPLVNNTQGGPAHDAHLRVINPFKEPIPRLYTAGELGSIWGYLYLGAGNLAECFITGQVAGTHAAGLSPWETK